MTSVGSQLYWAAFLTALLLLLRVKGMKPQKGSPDTDEGKQKEKTPSADERETKSGGKDLGPLRPGPG